MRYLKGYGDSHPRFFGDKQLGVQARQDPAYRATLLYVCLVTHAIVQDMREELVEVFARVRVNLRIFKGKIAGKRASSRTKRVEFRFICQWRLVA
jgi:hypothetical protein